MVAITNTTSLTFLKEAIDTTLGESESSLEAFAENQAEGAALERCIDAFQQLRGICQMLELDAATVMAEDMVLTAREVQRRPEPPLIQALGNAIVLLGHYLEYVQLSGSPLPEVLVAGINELRQAAGRAPLPESQFFQVDESLPRTPPGPSADVDGLARQSRRLRHMYQVGLLGLLRGQDRRTHLRLMLRAMERIDRLAGGKRWWLARAALESLLHDDMALTAARRALLARYDRQLKALVYDGAGALEREPPAELLRECLYLSALGSGKGDAATEVRSAFGLRERPADANLQRELALMTGSKGSVIRSVAGALKEEINQIKDTLDMAAQGVADTDYGAVAEGLGRIASTLDMIGENEAAQGLRRRAEDVAGWRPGGEVDSDAFHALVDDLLAAENTIATLERSLAPADDVRREVNNDRISRYQLDEARMTVVGECRAGLALAKRSLASYMEQQWDTMHLSNLPGTFASVVGGLTFLDLERACAVTNACRCYIEKELIGGSEAPTVTAMETLADALTAIDYYLESMEEQKPIGEGVLDVAEQAVGALGYPTGGATS